MKQKISVTVLACLLIISVNANADWTGKAAMQVDGKSAEAIVQAKTGLVRLDFSSPLPVTLITDLKSKSAWTLIPLMKMVMKDDFSRKAKEIPKCLGEPAHACFKREGFKKIGEETVNGYECEVLQSPGKDTKVWRPKEFPEVPFTKMITGLPEKPAELRITEIKNVTLDPGVFKIPDGYRDAGNMKNFLKNLKGK